MSLGIGLGITQQSVISVVTPLIPSDIAGLAAWYDASDTDSLTLSGVDVTQWDDQTANNYDLTQATEAAKPHSGGTINSLNVVEFDGDDDVLSGAHAVLTGAAGAVFIVRQIGGAANQNVAWMLANSGASDKMYSYIDWTGSEQTAFEFDTTVGTDNQFYGGTTIDLNPHLFVYQSDGSSYTMRVDGADESLTFDGGSNNGNWAADLTNAPDQIWLGSSNAGSFSNVIMAEAAFIDADVSDADRAGLELGLATKWGITLA